MPNSSRYHPMALTAGRVPGSHRGLPSAIADHLAGEGVATAQHPAPLPHVEGHGVGPAAGGGVQVDVVGDQEVAGPHRGGPRAGVEGGRAEVGRPDRVGQAGLQALVLPGPHRRQVAAVGVQGGVAVAVDGEAHLVGQAPGQAVGVGHRLLHGDAGHRHQGADVHGPEAGVLAVVAAHVDGLGRRPPGPHRRLDDGVGRPDEGDHGAVGAPAGVDVEQRHLLHRRDGLGQAADDRRVAAFGEVGDALEQRGLGHGVQVIGNCRPGLSAAGRLGAQVSAVTTSAAGKARRQPGVGGDREAAPGVSASSA